MKRTTNNTRVVRAITRGGIIAALYVALTYLSFAFGLSSGVIQFRLSEALTILPIFMPEAIVGLTAGCLISNLVTACAPWDILFGTLATLIGAVGAYLLRKARLKFVATIPTILANSLIVPAILLFVYEAEGSYPFFLLTVFIGEFVCAGILATILAEALSRHPQFSELNNNK